MLKKEPEKVRINPTSKLAKLIRSALERGEKIIIDTGEGEYAVVVEDIRTPINQSFQVDASAEDPNGLWEGYDPERALRNFDEVEGSWADLDTDELIANIYRWREEGSRPANRP